jgi:hypothetical protein
MSFKKWTAVIIVFAIAFGTGSFIRKSILQSLFAPKIIFHKKSHDFGKIERDKPVGTWFIFTNTGKMPLRIKNVVTSCDCTTAKYPDYGIKANRKDSIYIRFDASKKSNFYQQIYVFSNATETPIALYIIGECME